MGICASKRNDSDGTFPLPPSSYQISCLHLSPFWIFFEFPTAFFFLVSVAPEGELKKGLALFSHKKKGKQDYSKYAALVLLSHRNLIHYHLWIFSPPLWIVSRLTLCDLVSKHSVPGRGDRQRGDGEKDLPMDTSSTSEGLTNGHDDDDDEDDDGEDNDPVREVEEKNKEEVLSPTSYGYKLVREIGRCVKIKINPTFFFLLKKKGKEGFRGFFSRLGSWYFLLTTHKNPVGEDFRQSLKQRRSRQANGLPSRRCGRRTSRRWTSSISEGRQASFRTCAIRT